MKILISTPQFLPILNGVTFRVKMMTDYFTKMGHQVIIITPNKLCDKKYKNTNVHIFKDKKLTSKELTYLINDIGLIPCSKTDVDNGRKIKNFVKHSTPNTEVTRKTLQRVKEFIFPDLVIEDFLPKESKLNLNGVSLKDCVLSQRMDIKKPLTNPRKKGEFKLGIIERMKKG